MNLIIRSLLSGCMLFLLIVLPVTASPILTSDSFTPNPPLVPGGQQQVVATCSIPSGTSFPKDHELQMQTDLVDVQWTIQVILDGNNAARQTASGSAAFINGMILSYSVNHDVQFTVTINGNVPGSATGTVTVLNLVEIDNTNRIVPGSQIVIIQPVAGTTGALADTTIPTRTPSLVPASPPAIKSPGFSAFFSIAGCCLAGLALTRRGDNST